jgi:hypothetical protein
LGGLAGNAEPGADLGPGVPGVPQAADGLGDRVVDFVGQSDHSSTRAALIYLHATQERDDEIAAGMGKLLQQARRKTAGGAGTERTSGTQRARRRKTAS